MEYRGAHPVDDVCIVTSSTARALRGRTITAVNRRPGRVVTLIKSKDPDAMVWGIAYKIRTEDIEEVTNHLDFREKNGYSKKTVWFHPKDTSIKPFSLTLYIATEKNDSYAGPAPIETIARQIVDCVGPSGPNKEYVYNLAAAMRQLAPEALDDHLSDLEKAVQTLDPDIENNYSPVSAI